jgi:hypothetical protein
LVLSDIDFSKEFGKIEFGEINNDAINQFTDSLNEYFESENIQVKSDFMKDFGYYRFGEINNLFLSDFDRAFFRFFFS